MQKFTFGNFYHQRTLTSHTGQKNQNDFKQNTSHNNLYGDSLYKFRQNWKSLGKKENNEIPAIQSPQCNQHQQDNKKSNQTQFQKFVPSKADQNMIFTRSNSPKFLANIQTISAFGVHHNDLNLNQNQKRNNKHVENYNYDLKKYQSSIKKYSTVNNNHIDFSHQNQNKVQNQYFISQENIIKNLQNKTRSKVSKNVTKKGERSQQNTQKSSQKYKISICSKKQKNKNSNVSSSPRMFANSNSNATSNQKNLYSQIQQHQLYFGSMTQTKEQISRIFNQPSQRVIKQCTSRRDLLQMIGLYDQKNTINNGGIAKQKHQNSNIMFSFQQVKQIILMISSKVSICQKDHLIFKVQIQKYLSNLIFAFNSAIQSLKNKYEEEFNVIRLFKRNSSDKSSQECSAALKILKVPQLPLKYSSISEGSQPQKIDCDFLNIEKTEDIKKVSSQIQNKSKPDYCSSPFKNSNLQISPINQMKQNQSINTPLKLFNQSSLQKAKDNSKSFRIPILFSDDKSTENQYFKGKLPSFINQSKKKALKWDQQNQKRKILERSKQSQSQYLKISQKFEKQKEESQKKIVKKTTQQSKALITSKTPDNRVKGISYITSSQINSPRKPQQKRLQRVRSFETLFKALDTMKKNIYHENKEEQKESERCQLPFNSKIEKLQRKQKIVQKKRMLTKNSKNDSSKCIKSSHCL